jgi:hypothetical protein
MQFKIKADMHREPKYHSIISSTSEVQNVHKKDVLGIEIAATYFYIFVP